MIGWVRIGDEGLLEHVSSRLAIVAMNPSSIQYSALYNISPHFAVSRAKYTQPICTASEKKSEPRDHELVIAPWVQQRH